MFQAVYFAAFCAGKKTVDAEIFSANLTFSGVFRADEGVAFGATYDAVRAKYASADSAAEKFAGRAQDGAAPGAGNPAVVAYDMSIDAGG